ncbi:MAG: diacylglycerol kinase family protein [Bacteroidetes bacterium]|nr:MAG: diacylglycerol kinase family protein [Bacteroidota bacterium]
MSFVFRTQFNFRVHLIISIIVFIFSWYFRVTLIEWCVLLLCIGSVLTAELVNTSIEQNTDLVTREQNELAKNTKDIAAAAVLTVSVVSAIIGIIIFLPHFIQEFNS